MFDRSLIVKDMKKDLVGAELIASFVAKHCFPKTFLVTGGACAFIVDSLSRHQDADYICMQHEQAAAMAVDGVWRSNGKVGVTISTSGPGATNLITGIACSWFDSIPALHITGQVNQRESAAALGLKVRQAGFQETDIVSMVGPITKYATKVTSTLELASALVHGYKAATTGRMGPVVIDVPMDVQQMLCSQSDIDLALADIQARTGEDIGNLDEDRFIVEQLIDSAMRPLVIFGAGLGFSGKARVVQDWCESNHIPYCASWGGLPFIDRSRDLYQGALGVYGSRQANWAIQSADKILSLGSRLDNRQRTGNPSSFAPYAQILVVDIDMEELRKFANDDRYRGIQLDLIDIELMLPAARNAVRFVDWCDDLKNAAAQNDTGFEVAVSDEELNPYEVVQETQRLIKENAIVVADCGANLCWVYQAFKPGNQLLFTAGGNSPMGYSLPASIGAKVADPDRQVVCFIGDGGFQMNIQELQTIVNYQLDIKIIILNNNGYGIIKQFQDAYFESRYEATGRGYSVPDFGAVSKAYGIEYSRITKLGELRDALKRQGARIIDVILPENSLITPKVEMDRFIHDQFPYGNLQNRDKPSFSYPDRPSQLGV